MPGIDTNTRLYLPFNSTSNGVISTLNSTTDLLDCGSAPNVWTKTSTPVLSTAQYKHFPSSLLFAADQAVRGTTKRSTGAFTISVWVRSTNLAAANMIWDEIAGTSGSHGFTLNITAAGTLTTQSYWAVASNARWDTSSAAGTILVNNWYHVVLRWDGTTTYNGVSVWCNGVNVANSTANNTETTAMSYAPSIGLQANGTSVDFIGNMSDLRYYNHAITNAEIATLYNSGSGYTLSLGDEYWWLKFLSNDKGNPIESKDFGSSSQTITTVGTAIWQSVTTKIYDTSLNFDGGSDYLNVDGLRTTLASATSGTISAWVYIASDNANSNNVFALNRFTSSNPNTWLVFECDMRDSNFLWLSCRIDNVQQFEWTGAGGQLTPLIGTWAHIAVVQNGVSPVIYLNGTNVTSGGTWITSTNLTKWWKALLTDATYVPDSCTFGVEKYSASYYYYFNGNMSDYRIWTSELSQANITTLYNSGSGTSSAIGSEIFWLKPNVVANIPAYVGTSVQSTTHTCADTFLTDYGSASNTITFGATGRVQAVTTKVWNAALSFDGTATGYVSANGLLTSLASATTGTMAYWIYPAVDSNVNDIHLSVCRYAAYAGRNSLDCAMLFGAAADQLWIACRTDNTTQWAWTSIADYTDRMIGYWTHIAITHNGTTPAIYVNGVDVTATAGSFTTSTDKTKWWKAVITDATNKADNFLIGAYAYNGAIANYQNCKMSDVRIYTSCLTPANISTLYNGGAGTKSAIGSELFWTNGSYYYLTDTTTLFLDGNSDYISISDMAAFELGSGDFTIEAFVYISSFSGANAETPVINFGLNSTGSSPTDLKWGLRINTTTINFDYVYDGPTGTTISKAATFAVSKWYHVAVCRNGNNLRLFQNGVQCGTTADVTGKSIPADSNTLYIGTAKYGAGAGSQYYLNGYVAHARLSGTARYTSNFSMPDGPFGYDSSATVSGTLSLATSSVHSYTGRTHDAYYDKSTNSFKLVTSGSTALEIY